MTSPARVGAGVRVSVDGARVGVKGVGRSGSVGVRVGEAVAREEVGVELAVGSDEGVASGVAVAAGAGVSVAVGVGVSVALGVGVCVEVGGNVGKARAVGVGVARGTVVDTDASRQNPTA